MPPVQLPDLEPLSPRLIRPYHPSAVTTRSDREVDPRSVGLEQEDVEAIWQAVVRCYEARIYPAIAICLRRRGEIILDRSIGHARGNAPDDAEDAPKELATPDTLYNFFSGSKAVTAMLVHLCHERELLHVDEPVSTFIPEFARKRKHRITIRDVLCHRAGIPLAPKEVLDLDLLARPDEIIERLCDLEPIAQPGGNPAYHAVTGGFVLAEVIRRVTGRDVQTFLNDEVRAPLGMQSFAFGVPKERLGDCAVDAATGPLPFGPHKYLLERALGFPMLELVATTNDDRFRTGVVPAGNIFSTPEEIGRFFETLNCGGTYDGKHIFAARTIQRATEPQIANKIDRVLMMPIVYSMGFMLGHPIFSFFGPRTPKAFGHLGFMNSLGWADPERDISCALMTTGKVLLTSRLVYWFDIMRTICTRIPRDRAEV